MARFATTTSNSMGSETLLMLDTSSPRCVATTRTFVQTARWASGHPVTMQNRRLEMINLSPPQWIGSGARSAASGKVERVPETQYSGNAVRRLSFQVRGVMDERVSALLSPRFPVGTQLYRVVVDSRACTR